MFEVLNSGWWYDLGFYAAIISGFGSISLFRKKDKPSAFLIRHVLNIKMSWLN